MAQPAPITSSPVAVTVDIDRWLGVFIVIVVPTLFWTAMSYAIASGLGATLSWAVLGGIAFCIAAFLTVIYRVLSHAST